MRGQCINLTREELDFVILGQIMANVRCEDGVGARSEHRNVPRQHSSMCFFHHRTRICKEIFLALHGVGKFNLFNLHKEQNNPKIIGFRKR